MISETLKLKIKEIVGEKAVRFNESMAFYTTFQIGGPAECVALPHTEEEICALVALCRSARLPVRIMGFGSDLLICDEGLSGVVVRLADNFSNVYVEGTRVVAQAGAGNAQVAKAACAAGLTGYEFASGIPGSVGGAAIMNAGAYGGEFRNVGETLRCLTPSNEIVEVSARDADWSYRHSMMDDRGYIVLEVVLSLAFDKPDAIQKRMDDLLRRRIEKQPLEMPSAGSTFKRPEGYFAGKLIEEAGLRGYRVGGAQVSEKHCGFVVNVGAATASEIRQIINDVQERVLEKSGVRLEPEVRMWGFSR